MVATKEQTLTITEIFYSIQGEGSFAGEPCAFVRLTGCHLRCIWCDSEYSFFGGEKISLFDIMDRLSQFPTKNVEITGGEPLLQKNVYSLMKLLDDRGYRIMLETSGARSIEQVPTFVHIVMDLKAPGSGEVNKNIYANLDFLKPSDDLKIVIRDEADFRWTEKIVKDKNIHSKLLRPPIVQPSFGEMEPAILAELVKQSALPFRLGLQLHKYIYSPELKGV